MKGQQDSIQNGALKEENAATTSSIDLDDSLLKSSTPSDLISESSVDREARLAIPSRPAASFAALITEAINSSPEKQMVLSDIYSYIEGHYKYFKTAGSGWKNSVRHNLSLKRNFCKVPRPNQAPGKGSYWRVVDDRTAIIDDPKINGPLRRNSMNPFTKDRSGISSRPRSSSQGSTSHLPLIKPRPQFAYGYGLTGYGNWASLGFQGYSPQSYPFTIEVPIAGGYQQQPLQKSADVMGSVIEAANNQFTLETNSNPAVQIPITGHFPDTSGYFNDVWLGAGTPKQTALETVASPREYLRLSPENIGNSIKRSPQFHSFDHGL